MPNPREGKPRPPKRKPPAEDARSKIDPRLLPFFDIYVEWLVEAVLNDPRLAHMKAEIDARHEVRRTEPDVGDRKRRPED